MTGPAWTSTTEIATKVRRRWDDGTLLRAFAVDRPFPIVDVRLRGPRTGEIGEQLGDVQTWIDALEHGSQSGKRFDLTYAAVGGRLVGRNRLPARAVIRSYDQAWALLGVLPLVRRYESVVATTRAIPPVHRWVCDQPFKALEHAEWPQLLAAYEWLDAARGSGRRLRQVDAPGVDTKFVERHRSVLAALLGVPGSASGFARALGLATAPESVRLRFDEGFAGMPECLSEGVFLRSELARLPVSVQTALIIENEATYLSVDVPAQGVVVWGKGFEVDRAGSLPWLRDADVVYWGDLDTHGFAILDRLRAWLPQTRSILMDRETLLRHRARWVVEKSPTRARLSRLDRDELALYDDLVSDRLGDRVRLEQERVDWLWAADRLDVTLDG